MKKELEEKKENLELIDIQGNSYSKDFCQSLGEIVEKCPVL
jgi:hypothetical protein